MVPTKLNPVKSSNIAAAGYNAEGQRLVILFHNGRSYAYSPVSLDTYNELLTAESVGEYFFKNIKTNPEIKCTQL